jgi:hypothetical protein
MMLIAEVGAAFFEVIVGIYFRMTVYHANKFCPGPIVVPEFIHESGLTQRG